MLRDYLTPSLPTLSIGTLSVASGGDTFTGLHAAFSGLPNGLIVALAIAAALRVSFFLFADSAVRQDIAGWARALCIAGIVLVMAASAATGALPGSILSPVERMTLDAVILGLIGFRNSGVLRTAESGGGSGSRAPPPEFGPARVNGLELIDLLDRYTVEELGGLFLYMPMPEPAGRARLQPWVLLLQARNVVKNDPWVVYPEDVRVKIRENYPQLFDSNPGRFYIYRLDKEALAKLLASL